MAVDDLLRVAWLAQQGGQRRLREVMLTLAIGRAGPSAPWAERCRARLLQERPGHFLGAWPDLDQALADPRVDRSLRKLAAQYPPARVGWLRLRFESADGPFTGEEPPLGSLLDALIGPPAEAEVRRDAPEAARGPLARSRVEAAIAHAGLHPSRRPTIFFGEPEQGPEPVADAPAGPEDDENAFYLAVLLSIAILLATKPARGRDAA